MFVGREPELSTLERLYQKPGFQFVVMYGRRRVGKTTLITQFLEGKDSIAFSAQEANDHMNLQIFSREVFRFFEVPEEVGAFMSWNDAFAYLARHLEGRRLMLAIDGYPYAAQANQSLNSILQNAIDHELKNTELFLILCGSQISFMESEVLGYKSPLFGRRTAQMKIEGFDYFDAARLMPGFSDEDKVRLYSCIGGTPHYLAQINPAYSVEDNLKELYFNTAGYLYDEPVMLLQQELRELAMYNSIISAIAGGANRLHDISTKIGEEARKVSKYLDTLINLRIILKDYPFGDNPAKSRKSLYRIADHCYGFWYRYVFQNRGAIEKGSGAAVADQLVFPNLPEYIGKPAFEEICLQYIIRLNRKGALPFLATEFGGWWGTDNELRKQTDIHIVAHSGSGGAALLGECKWRGDLDEVAEIKKLMEKQRLLPGYQSYYYYFFSKHEFGPAAQKLAKETPALTLVPLGRLFESQS